MSLKKHFITKVSSVRDLGHSDRKVTNTTAIDYRNNDCIRYELRDKLMPPKHGVGEVKKGDVDTSYFLWLGRCTWLDFGKLPGYLWNGASQQSL